MFKPYDEYLVENFRFINTTIWFQHGDWVQLKPSHEDKTCYFVYSSMELTTYCSIQNCLRRKGIYYLDEIYLVGKEIEKEVINQYGHLIGAIDQNNEFIRFRIRNDWTP